MTDDTTPPPLLPTYNERVEQLILHLLHHPADLIDVRRLMHDFQTSVAEVQQALGWLEKHRLSDEEEPQE